MTIFAAPEQRRARCEAISRFSFTAKNGETGSCPKSADISEKGYERTKFQEAFARASCKPSAPRGIAAFKCYKSNLVSPSPGQICHSAKKKTQQKTSNLKLKGTVFTLEVQPELFSTLIQLPSTRTQTKKNSISFLRARSIKLLLLPLLLHVVIITIRRGS